MNVDIKEVSANSLSFIGDAIYTLKVREFYISKHYQKSSELPKLCNRYVSARGQAKVFKRLLDESFFTDLELEIFKRGRNHITHIPKNGDLLSYQTASGLEAICGYLYLTDKNRLDELFIKIFEGGIENE